MCDAWCVYSWAIRPSFSLRPRSPIRYNLITKSLLQNVSYIRFLCYLSGFFCLILCIRFVFGIFARFKPKKSHARRSRTIIVRPFAFPFPPPSFMILQTYIYLVYTSNLPRYIRTYAYVYLCINRRCDNDPDSRADKNSSQSIIRFMNMYV